MTSAKLPAAGADRACYKLRCSILGPEPPAALRRAGGRRQRREPAMVEMRSLRQVALPAALERSALVAMNGMVKRVQPVDDAAMDAQHGVTALRT